MATGAAPSVIMVGGVGELFPAITNDKSPPVVPPMRASDTPEPGSITILVMPVIPNGLVVAVVPTRLLYVEAFISPANVAPLIVTHAAVVGPPTKGVPKASNNVPVATHDGGSGWGVPPTFIRGGSAVAPAAPVAPAVLYGTVGTCLDMVPEKVAGAKIKVPVVIVIDGIPVNNCNAEKADWPAPTGLSIAEYVDPASTGTFKLIPPEFNVIGTHVGLTLAPITSSLASKYVLSHGVPG